MWRLLFSLTLVSLALAQDSYTYNVGFGCSGACPDRQRMEAPEPEHPEMPERAPEMPDQSHVHICINHWNQLFDQNSPSNVDVFRYFTPEAHYNTIDQANSDASITFRPEDSAFSTWLNSFRGSQSNIVLQYNTLPSGEVIVESYYFSRNTYPTLPTYQHGGDIITFGDDCRVVSQTSTWNDGKIHTYNQAPDLNQCSRLWNGLYNEGGNLDTTSLATYWATSNSQANFETSEGEWDAAYSPAQSIVDYINARRTGNDNANLIADEGSLHSGKGQVLFWQYQENDDSATDYLKHFIFGVDLVRFEHASTTSTCRVVSDYRIDPAHLNQAPLRSYVVPPADASQCVDNFKMAFSPEAVSGKTYSRWFHQVPSAKYTVVDDLDTSAGSEDFETVTLSYELGDLQSYVESKYKDTTGGVVTIVDWAQMKSGHIAVVWDYFDGVMTTANVDLVEFDSACKIVNGVNVARTGLSSIYNSKFWQGTALTATSTVTATSTSTSTST
eukprot:NODE_1167_length_1625_cov_263.910547_g1098_i0.p1 GENE.NODE_1167_length_1625_cov_263.910547_g1098_i0~~NODE_1167_length_1625_cov_263.910547_g1098_i0.p1  ORF type:complete len:508 (-),score=90.39 NODE_1167_length_1625_cov_263.910547_g1098_i0:101-1597(-)